MTKTARTPRRLAVLIPVLLLWYGVLRLIDGMDGEHGPGLAWNLGHVSFLGAFVLLGALVVALRRLVPETTARRRAVADTAMVAGLSGAVCFLWVILGDLSPALSDAAPLPAPLQLAGPLAFQGGLLTLLTLLATARPRRLPVRTPVLTFVAFALITVNLDLLPVAALTLLAALAPLTSLRPAPDSGARQEKRDTARTQLERR
ncbi:hypothetical protein [Streptomyces sp. VRA16 Mangrove soil]|uniref:hypothetical protein n=1 Tax=Streptomyces sp. VRA16 Mangrove soil TaxID=2817434 RepID=UPI001E4B81C2|nr:hypothetical protein [Streptomyces sp. VRA16 Mangrove soil]